MFGKLVSLLAHSKGAAAAIVVAGSAVTGGTVASTEVRDAVSGTVQTVSQTVTETVSTTVSSITSLVTGESSQCSKPEKVAQRNAAAWQLREAYKTQVKALRELAAPEGADKKDVRELLRAEEKALKDRLEAALNDVAAETLGRKGQLEDEDDTDTEGETDTAVDTDVDTTDETTLDPTAPAESKPGCPLKMDVELEGKVKDVVDTAVQDMQDMVTEAEEKLAGLDPEDAGTESAQRTKPAKGSLRPESASDKGAKGQERGKSGR